MGIRLVMDAADHGPASSLTWRERCVLLILSASAMDATRELPPGIEERPDLIRRLGMGRSQRYDVFASLVAKGALERVERGRNGVKAVYAIAPFAVDPEAGRPGDPDARPVDNPADGSGEPGPISPVKGPGSEGEGSGNPGLKRPENPDPAPSYEGIRGFKTGGTPPAPRTRPLIPYGLPTPPLEEGDRPGSENPVPCGTGSERAALAAEITGMRPEWSKRSVLRALERPAVTGRPWPVAAQAMRLVAADRATNSPGRLEHDGPWWAQAARTVSGLHLAAPATHPYKHNPGTGCCRTCGAPQVDKSHRHRHRKTA